MDDMDGVPAAHREAEKASWTLPKMGMPLAV
jgi:hypothetical protein